MIGFSKSKQLISPKKIFVTNDVELSNTPASDALVFALVPILVSTNELFKQFIKAYLEFQTPLQYKQSSENNLSKLVFLTFTMGTHI